MTTFAPKSHLLAPVWNWTPFYTEMVKQVRQGTWKNTAHWWGMETGVVDISPMSALVPKEIQDKVLAKKAEIIAGSLEPFTGPVKDQAGAVRIPDGQRRRTNCCWAWTGSWTAWWAPPSDPSVPGIAKGRSFGNALFSS